MAIALNFTQEEKTTIAEVLKAFRSLPTNTPFEEKRWKVFDCIVTLYSTGKLVIQGREEERVREFLLEKLNFSEELVLGIDEAGRGEHFGPMVVAAVLADRNRLRELRDSKKITNLGEKASVVRKAALSTATVAFSPELIDHLRKNGMNINSMEAAAINAFTGLYSGAFPKLKVRVDGEKLTGCSPSAEFVVKGDDLDPVIGAASVLAKLEREASPNKGERKTWKKKNLQGS